MEEKWKRKTSESVGPALLNGVFLPFQIVLSYVRYGVTVEAEIQ